MRTRRNPRTEPRPATESRELRIVPVRPELREAGAGGGSDDTIPFRGSAIVYDEWTEIADWWFGSFMERFAAGSVTDTIAADDIRLLTNHDPNLVLARRRGDASDTLRLTDTSTALIVEAELAPTSYGRDLAISLARGDVSGMSFAFEVLGETWDERPDGMWLRTVTKARLYDVSVVTYPAYPQSDAGLRSLLARVPAIRAGRRNSAADEEVIRAAVEALRAHADELDGLIGATNEADPPADEAETDRARARAQALRHTAIAARFGLGRAS